MGRGFGGRRVDQCCELVRFGYRLVLGYSHLLALGIKKDLTASAGQVYVGIERIILNRPLEDLVKCGLIEGYSLQSKKIFKSQLNICASM